MYTNTPTINSYTSSQTHPCSHIALCINRNSHTFTVTHSLIHEFTQTFTCWEQHNSLPHNIPTYMHMLHIYSNTSKYTYTHAFSHTQACSHILMCTLAHSPYTWIHAQIYSCLWTWPHPLMHTAHTFILHSHKDHTFTHMNIPWTHTNMLMHSIYLVLVSLFLSFIQKTFRKRVLHHLIFSLFWPDPFFSAYCSGPFSKCLACIN